MTANDFHTGAIYDSEAQARLAFEALVDLPLTHPDITLIEPAAPQQQTDATLGARLYLRQLIEEALSGAGKGAGAGASIGGLGAILLAAHNPALFIAAPILSGLAISAWGAWFGGAIGIALHMQHDSLDAALEAASQSGHWCLVIHTRGEEDHERVLKLLAAQPEVQVKDNEPQHRTTT
jgi:hypothetical protein